MIAAGRPAPPVRVATSQRRFAMHRPARIIDAHMHLLTAGTDAVKRQRMAELDPRLQAAYRRRWQESLASRREDGPEAAPADVQTVAARWEAALDAAGIARGVFFTSPNYHDDLRAFIALNPDRFVGYTTLDPTSRANADRLRRQIDEHGVRGLKLYPMALGFHVDDEACDAVYEVCEAARIPVVIHFGISINATHDLRYGNPLDLAGPALRFPAVSWIVPHFGAGFFREALMVAAQYQNVYIDSSSSNNWTRYTPDRPSLADLFRQTLDAVGPERLIFGTDSSFFPRGYRTNILNEQLAICDGLGLPPGQIDLIFAGNIQRLLDGFVPEGRR
jgi:predicted TIM-barrel fold metal-dependent hydrolase